MAAHVGPGIGEDENTGFYVLFMQTWQRLMWVRRSPAFSVVGTGFLEMRRFWISTFSSGCNMRIWRKDDNDALGSYAV